MQRFHGDNSGGKHITNSNVGQRPRQVNACVVDETALAVPGNATMHNHITKMPNDQVHTDIGGASASTANLNSLRVSR